MPKISTRLTPPGSRRASLSRRLPGVARWLLLVAVASIFTPTGGAAQGEPSPATTPSAVIAPPPPVAGIPGDVVAALRKLKTPADSERNKVYAILTDRGDARIIPALNAFLNGNLRLREDQLIYYDKVKETQEDGETVKIYQVVDALTGNPVVGPDGQQIYEKANTSPNFAKPLRVPQREPILDLIATLSLLHPDPEIRLSSIREAGERASRVFPDAEDESRIVDAMKTYLAGKTAKPGASTLPASNPANAELALAIDAAMVDRPTGLLSPVPGEPAISKVRSALGKVMSAAKEAGATTPSADDTKLDGELKKYLDKLDVLKKSADELPKYAAAFKKQLAAEPNGPFTRALTEAKALTDCALGDVDVKPDAVNKSTADRDLRKKAAGQLGEFGTSRAANVLRKLYSAAVRSADGDLASAVAPSLSRAESYQTKIRLVQYTFAGLSTGSIYVLLALGLAIIFGLMGVINMAHGEFMMVGAFTTLWVTQKVTAIAPAYYDYFPMLAVPAAFIVAGTVGLLTEYLVIRHLYGRTTETLIATIGVGVILVQTARTLFGSSVSVAAPRWMQGSMEVIPELLLNRARFWTIVYCILCVVVVYLIVNKTKLGLMLRATTQNRKMAAALGVPTRSVDALTFAFGAGLAGMAGVVVPMIDKINPEMGQDYVVMSFMVVVVGGVGKLAGAILAGLGLGAIGNYLEPALSSVQMFARTSSVLSKVLVLAAIVAFLQKRPSGLFPPKGRVADA